jgi:hypothetical protein
MNTGRPDLAYSGASAKTHPRLFWRVRRQPIGSNFIMSPTVYHIVHLVSLFVLFGYTFYAFAAPAEARKKVLMITGIASVLVLISGFGLMSKVYQNHFYAWMIVKLVAWLGISALAGLGFRRRGSVGVFAIVAVTLALAAVIAVYVKPF